jgi:hypothetical protein
MSPWVPIVISGVFATAAIAERFYSRFVPDVSDQKRHLKAAGRHLATVGFISYNVISAAAVGVGFWNGAHESGPVTRTTVILYGAMFSLLSLLTVNLLAFVFHLMQKDQGRDLDLIVRNIQVAAADAKVLHYLASKVGLTEEVKGEYMRTLRALGIDPPDTGATPTARK